jgi:hypothetical protein
MPRIKPEPADNPTLAPAKAERIRATKEQTKLLRAGYERNTDSLHKKVLVVELSAQTGLSVSYIATFSAIYDDDNVSFSQPDQMD